jgi:hypothetical protein
MTWTGAGLQLVAAKCVGFCFDFKEAYSGAETGGGVLKDGDSPRTQGDAS